MSTIPQSSTDSQPENASLGTASAPSSFWTTVYSSFLLALVVAYFALMFFIAGEFLQWAYRLIRDAGNQPLWGTVMYLLGAAGLAVLLIRTVRHLIYACWGLVTPANDLVPEAEEGIEVDREQYPKLFAMIDRVREAVDAPQPDEVRIHFGPEPGTFEMREFGVYTQRKLIMLLSLPQMGVFNEKEFGVILAHELSHFGCGYTRLVVFLERFVNALRTSVEAGQNRWWRWIDPIYWLQYVYLRMLILLTAPMQQRQEFRADSVSASIFGGDVAAHTLLKNWLLGNQFLTAITSYEPGKNGDDSENVFQWFRSQWRDYTADGEDYLLKRLESLQKPSFWNDDPTISQRVALMRTFPPKDAGTTRPMREVVEDLGPLEKQLHDMLLADD